MSQNCTLQAVTSVLNDPAGYTLKTIGSAIVYVTPIVTDYLKTIKAAVISNIITPTYNAEAILAKAQSINDGSLLNGISVLEPATKHILTPIDLQTLLLNQSDSAFTVVKSIQQGSNNFGLLNYWAPKVNVTEVAQEIVKNTGNTASSYVPDVSSLIPDVSSYIPDVKHHIPDVRRTPDVNSWIKSIPSPSEIISKIPVISTIVKHPGKSIALYLAVGCAAVYTIKRLQLYYLQKEFLKTLEATEATRDPHQWTQCKDMMHQFSPTNYPNINAINTEMAMKFVTNLSPADISNKFLKKFFPLHTLVAYAANVMSNI